MSVHSAGTSHSAAVEITETESKGSNDVPSQGIVDSLVVVVGGIGYRQILGLPEYVVSLDCKGNLVLEQSGICIDKLDLGGYRTHSQVRLPVQLV